MTLKCASCGHKWQIDKIPDNYRHQFVVCPQCKKSDLLKYFIGKNR